MADLVGELTGLPATGVIAVTLLLASIVAGSGAALACAIVARINPEQLPDPNQHL